MFKMKPGGSISFQVFLHFACTKKIKAYDSCFASSVPSFFDFLKLYVYLEKYDTYRRPSQIAVPSWSTWHPQMEPPSKRRCSPPKQLPSQTIYMYNSLWGHSYTSKIACIFDPIVRTGSQLSTWTFCELHTLLIFSFTIELNPARSMIC